MKKHLFALCLVALPALLFADQKFTFALPDLEGRISLGVFNERGKLVRTLFVGATQADFTVGLNGLITTWDGKSDIGVVMPSGKYFVRGFVVGDAVKAEGEAYHFNDWIEDEKSPRIVNVYDFQKIDRGFLLLVAALEGGNLRTEVARYDLEKGFLWHQPLIDHSAGNVQIAPRLAVSDSVIAAFAVGGFQLFNFETGEALSAKSPELSSFALAAEGKALFAISLQGLEKFSLPDLAPEGVEVLPVIFNALAVAPGRKIGSANSTPYVWIAEGTEWKKVYTGAIGASLSFGSKDTFWLAGSEEKGGAPLVGQFDSQGQLLRAYRGDFAPEQVRASTEREAISVLEKKGKVQRLRQMSLVERAGGGTEWEISFEKAITPCGKYGIVNGTLVADAGDTPQRGSMEFPLATGGLTPSSPKLTVQLASDGTGLWLETASKLKLIRLADQLHADRFVLVPGENKTSMTAYAGDGVVVAEYMVTGLDAIAEIDAGEIEIP